MRAMLLRIATVVVVLLAGSSLGAQAGLSAAGASLGAQAGPPLPRWQATLEWAVAGSPVVADGIVYAGSVGGPFHAYDAATGAERWRTDADGFLSPPAVRDGVVYVGASGAIVALDADTGAERWRYTTGTLRMNLAAPAVTEDLVVVCDDNGPAVVALEASTGQERWQVELEDEARCTPVIVGGTVFACDRAGYVYALDLASGSERWRQRLHPLATVGANFCNTLAVADDTVFVAIGPVSPLFALDVATGEERWRSASSPAPSSEEIPGPPVIADGVVYAALAHRGELAALDARTGEALWRTAFGTEGIGAPVLANGELYAGLVLERLDPRLGEPSRGIGALAAVDAQSGTEQWRVELDGLVTGPPAVVDGDIYVGTDQGTLVALG